MFNPRLATKIDRAMTRFLTHRCTLIRFVATGSEDEEGRPTYTEQVTMGIRCLFLWKETSITDDRGTVESQTPILYMDRDQTVTVGDQIRNVYARNGSTILLHNAVINTIDSTAESGNAAVKVCELEGARI